MTTQNTAPRVFDNPRYSRTARAAIAKWHRQIFPVDGITEDILVARKDHDQIHFLFTLIRDVLEHYQALRLAVIDNSKMSRSEAVSAEAEARKPLAMFRDEMKEAHRADWQTRKDRRQSDHEAPAAAERATG